MLSKETIYQLILLLEVTHGVASYVRSEPLSTRISNIQLCQALNTNLTNTLWPIPDLKDMIAGSKEDCALGLPLIYEAANANSFTRNMFKLLLRHPFFQISFHAPLDENTKAASVAHLDRFVIHINPKNTLTIRSIIHEVTHLLLAFIYTDLKYPHLFPLIAPNIYVSDIFSLSTPKMESPLYDGKKKFLILKGAYRKETLRIPMKHSEKTMIDHFKKSLEKEKPDDVAEVLFTQDEARAFSQPGHHLLLKICIFPDIIRKPDDTFTILSSEESPSGKVLAQIKISNPFLAFLLNQHNHFLKIENYLGYDIQNEEFITYASQIPTLESTKALYEPLYNILDYHINRLLAKYPPTEREDILKRPQYFLFHEPNNILSSQRMEKELIISIALNPDNYYDSAFNSALSSIAQIIAEGQYDTKTLEAYDRLLYGELLFSKKYYKLAYVQYKTAYKLDPDSFENVSQTTTHFQKAAQLSGHGNAPGHIQRAAKQL